MFTILYNSKPHLHLGTINEKGRKCTQKISKILVGVSLNVGTVLEFGEDSFGKGTTIVPELPKHYLEQRTAEIFMRK